jgi:flagellar motor switch protein FliN/FliY
MSFSQSAIDEPLAAESANVSEKFNAPRANSVRTVDIERILGIEVPVSVTLAERDMSIRAILDMKVGTIVEFDVAFDSDLLLLAADCYIGSGQAVKVGENFGLRISRIGTVKHRIGALAGEAGA